MAFQEFVYTPDESKDARDRFRGKLVEKQTKHYAKLFLVLLCVLFWEHPFSERKFVSERMLSVKARPLEYVLQPQPEASAIIAKLLHWIDSADLASQAGASRPIFATRDGDPIFPNNDDPWWLTEVARVKLAEEKAKGDEDGPPSSEEDAHVEEDARKEFTASESEDDGLHDGSLGWRNHGRAILPIKRTNTAASSSSTDSPTKKSKHRFSF